ncbi:MAG: hypothetical protein E7641_04680 [Ruminococcaceae bacterium]|nr:hypothetical protein [Oscillospiraceae bacterium]
MYLTALFKDKANITYSYTKRHTSIPLAPNVDREAFEANIYKNDNGNLFFGQTVSWKGSYLLNSSIDINITLDRRYFIDRVTLRLTEGSALGGIYLLTDCGRELKKIGVLSGEAVRPCCDLTVSVGYFCESLILRLEGAYSNVGIESLEVYAAGELENAIYPIPDSVELLGGVLPYDKIKTVSSSDECASRGEEYLIEKLFDSHGIKPEHVSCGGDVRMILSAREDDGYEIEVSGSGCVIKAGNKRGFIYAADTLIKLCRKDGIAKGRVSDKPMMDMRGVHFSLPSRSDIPFLKRLIKELLVPMRYNMAFIQISGVMRYDNYPEINEMWLKACRMYEAGKWPLPAHYHFLGHDILEKDEVADLCEYLRDFGIEVVPEVQCLSHSQYITTAYPFLAEIEKTSEEEENLYAADAKPTAFYHHNMCPSHPEYYDYVFGIADEVIEVMRPERFLHMGHDEVYLMGKCEKCAKKGGAAVYAEEVARLNEFVKSRGLTMMIWSDMLQNKRYSVPEAIGLVPRDIIMLDFTWYFDLDKDIEDNLLSAGFKVMMGNMYSSHYTRYNKRSKKKGIIGAEVSTWVDCNEHSYAYEGKMYDLVYSANTMWSDSYDTEYRATYNELVTPILWEMRKAIGQLPECKEEKTLEIGGDMRNIPSELLWSTPYERAVALSSEAPELGIPFGGRADLFTFLHATDLPCDRVMWTPSEKIGEYVIAYEDGSEACQDMLYGDNILYYSVKYGDPLSSVLFRHEGYTGTYTSKPFCGKDAKGKDYTLLLCHVKNPSPEKPIKKLIARHTSDTDAKILIFEAKALSK